METHPINELQFKDGTTYGERKVATEELKRIADALEKLHELFSKVIR